MNKLDQIKKRIAAATPGPWFVGNEGRNGWNYVMVSTKPTPAGEALDKCDWDKAVIGVNCEYGHSKPNDLELIANAPTDLALLLRVVELQQTALKEYRDQDWNQDASLLSPAEEALADVDKLLEEG